MTLVRYPMLCQSVHRTRARKLGHGDPVQFTSETERRVDGSRRGTALWPRGATRCQTWAHRLINMLVRICKTLICTLVPCSLPRRRSFRSSRDLSSPTRKDCVTSQKSVCEVREASFHGMFLVFDNLWFPLSVQ